jgi:hypothetical protein
VSQYTLDGHMLREGKTIHICTKCLTGRLVGGVCELCGAIPDPRPTSALLVVTAIDYERKIVTLSAKPV